MSRRSHAAERLRDPDQGRVLFAEFLGVLAARLAGAMRGDLLPEAPAGERRWRKVVSTSTYDAWLVSWAPGTGIAEHDHGAATAAFHVLRGSLVERTATRTRVVNSGGVAWVPAWHRHEVRNVGTTPAVSLHVYSPPLGDAWEAS